MSEAIEQLRDNLDLGLVKADKMPEVAIAFSDNGGNYTGGKVESDTHLLHVPAEQVALCLAMQHSDFPIRNVTVMREQIAHTELMSPITLKILIDWQRRTNTPLGYRVVDVEGAELLVVDEVSELADHYNPASVPLRRVAEARVAKNNESLDHQQDLVAELKKYAKMGLGRNFPTYDTASGYATCVATKTGNLYFSGQYSSFEGKTNVHSEMAAVFAALMNRDPEITHLGLVSTKYPESPCNLCGCCRQFLTEVSSRYGLDLTIYTYALDTNEYAEHKLETYLPNQWSSKKW